jgi:hypothetical protein
MLGLFRPAEISGANSRSGMTFCTGAITEMRHFHSSMATGGIVNPPELRMPVRNPRRIGMSTPDRASSQYGENCPIGWCGYRLATPRLSGNLPIGRQQT